MTKSTKPTKRAIRKAKKKAARTGSVKARKASNVKQRQTNFYARLLQNNMPVARYIPPRHLAAAKAKVKRNVSKKAGNTVLKVINQQRIADSKPAIPKEIRKDILAFLG